MLMLGWSEAIDRLAMAGHICWYYHVLRREDGHVLSNLGGHFFTVALIFEIDGQIHK